jgi:hypothetical protein
MHPFAGNTAGFLGSYYLEIETLNPFGRLRAGF